MSMESTTGDNNYFEDFTPGMVIRHSRGKTIGELENVLVTNLVMNSAGGHFDNHVMRDTPIGERIVFGGATASLAIGLTMQDTGENALAELSMTKMRLSFPVKHGDTIYAISEVISVDATTQENAGTVEFHHWGFNQDDRIVFQCDRKVLIKKAASFSAANRREK